MATKIKPIVILFMVSGFFYNLSAEGVKPRPVEDIIAFHDAMRLVRFVDSDQNVGRIKFKDFDISKEGEKEQRNLLLSILASYDRLQNFLGNPFLNVSYLSSYAEKDTTPEKTPQEEKIYTGVEPIVISKLADAAVKFLAKRIKNELTITYFSNLKADFLSDKYEPLRSLFPNTYRQMQKIGGEIRNVPLYIDTLPNIFAMDIANTYSNYPQLVGMKTGKFKNYFKKNPELKMMFLAALHLSDSLLIKPEAVNHPGFVIAELDRYRLHEQGIKKPLTENVKNAVALLDIISTSLKEKEIKNSYWVSPDSLKSLFEKDNRTKITPFQIYLGLLYQQTKGIEFLLKKRKTGKHITLRFTDLLARARGKTAVKKELENMIEDFIYRAQRLEYLGSQAGILEIALQNGKPGQPGNSESEKRDIHVPSGTLCSGYFNAAVDLVDFSSALFDFVRDEMVEKKSIDLSRTPTPERFLKLVRHIGETYIDIKNSAYNSVVLNMLSVYDEIFRDMENKRTFKKNREKILKYGAFMAKMAQVKNSDEMADVIQSVALPTGTYSGKRHSAFSISLNAFLGLALSDEHLRGDKEKKILKKIDGLYVWVPIGIDLSARTRLWFVGSTSLFFSVLDLGAVAAFRFEDKNTDIPEFKLKNIIAPGVHLLWGIKKLPISIGAGIQYGPQLRKIGGEKGDDHIIESGAWRFNIFAALDIPLLRLK